ncbi:MAG: ParA family protein [Candidatus Omnitrophica bacterium]|nr:ParA family protein [Candidatus Omnitrophota bacterium]
MGRSLAICNQKGGVGKTTTAINLGAYLAQAGKRVLLVDADPQGNATSGLGVDKTQLERSLYHVLMGQSEAAQAILASPVQRIDLLPSTVDLTGAEVELIPQVGREFRLKEALDALKTAYEFILIDSPPSLGLLTVNALVAAETILIPMQCEYYALEGLSQLLKTIELVRSRLNPALAIEGVLLTMADYRTNLTQEVINEARGFFKEKVFQTVIPRNVRLSEAPGFGKPISTYDASSPGAHKYQELSQELLSRVNATVAS